MLEKIQNAVKSAFDPLQAAVQAKLPAEEINRSHEVSLSSFLNDFCNSEGFQIVFWWIKLFSVGVVL